MEIGETLKIVLCLDCFGLWSELEHNDCYLVSFEQNFKRLYSANKNCVGQGVKTRTHYQQKILQMVMPNKAEWWKNLQVFDYSWTNANK